MYNNLLRNFRLAIYHQHGTQKQVRSTT